MATLITPKTMAHMLETMVANTGVAKKFLFPEKHYCVLQGPKRWMDVFVHTNSMGASEGKRNYTHVAREYLHVGYGDDPDKSIRIYLSNYGDHEYFILNFHRYGPVQLIGRDKPKGPRLAQFAFRMGDGRDIEPHSDVRSHFDASDASVISTLARNKL